MKKAQYYFVYPIKELETYNKIFKDIIYLMGLPQRPNKMIINGVLTKNLEAYKGYLKVYKKAKVKVYDYKFPDKVYCFLTEPYDEDKLESIFLNAGEQWVLDINKLNK